MTDNGYLKAAVAAVATALTAALGGWDQLLRWLVAAMLLDFAAGLGRAILRGTRSSRLGLRGLVRKVLLLLLVAAGHVLDQVLAHGMAAVFQLDLQPDVFVVRTFVIYYLLVLELLSVVENLEEAGLRGPAFLRRVLAWFQAKLDAGPPSLPGDGGTPGSPGGP